MQNRNSLFGYQIYDMCRFKQYTTGTIALSGILFIVNCATNSSTSNTVKGLLSVGVFITMEWMALRAEHRDAMARNLFIN